MSFMGNRATKLAEGIREIVKKYDPEGKQGMSHAIDEYIEHWAWQTVQLIEEKFEKDREG